MGVVEIEVKVGLVLENVEEMLVGLEGRRVGCG
jgi:hypothetical protein